MLERCALCITHERSPPPVAPPVVPSTPVPSPVRSDRPAGSTGRVASGDEWRLSQSERPPAGTSITHTYTQTDTHTHHIHRQTHRQADTQTDRHTHTHTTQTDTQADRQTGRQTDRHTDRQIYGLTNRQAGRPADRQADRKTQTHRRTRRAIHRHRPRVGCRRLADRWPRLRRALLAEGADVNTGRCSDSRASCRHRHRRAGITAVRPLSRH